MSTMVETRTRTFQASAALAQFRRVKLNASNKLEYAGASDTDAVGVTAREAFAADEYISVILFTAQGTVTMTASEAISVSGAIYAAANGKVASSGSVLVGEALEAATADNDVIETLMSPAAIIGSIARSALAQDDLAEYAIPVTEMRVHDNFAALLPTTAATDDLAVIQGTPGTDAPSVNSSDAGGTTVTQNARFQFQVPPEYVDGETATLRIEGAMQVVSDGTATVDVSAYRQAAPSVDICATAAQSINSATPADKDFTLTPTSLVKGDVLDVLITVAITDAGDAAPNILAILSKISLLLDIKG